MGRWRVDYSQWPVALYESSGALTNEELDQFMRECSTALERQEPYVAIFDASGLGKVSAYMRSRAMAWQKEHEAALRRYCVGTAYVISSPLLRFIAMTVFMATRLPTPLKICESVEEAMGWARSRLDSAATSNTPR